MSELYILDVGHGNCSVLVSDGYVVVIDAGSHTTLLEFLAEEGITRIDVFLISHADADHLRGLQAVLASGAVAIGVVRLNADATKQTQLWDDILFTLNALHKTTNLDAQTALTTGDSRRFDCHDVQIEVLAPSLYVAGKSAGSLDRANRALTSNSNSAVIRLGVAEVPLVLLPGDLDQTGLSNLLEDGREITARVAVFPHHGGRPGKDDPVAFAEEFCRQAMPEVVIFSIGRGKYDTPRPDIVEAVRRELPNARIICTQLSQHCAETVSADAATHLIEKFAQGRPANACCGGTIMIQMQPAELNVSPGALHEDFVRTYASSALCGD